MKDKPLPNLATENDTLRALLAWGSDPCVYCGLPASDFGKCRHGFPGCGRADDMMLRPEKEGWTRAANPTNARQPHD